MSIGGFSLINIFSDLLNFYEEINNDTSANQCYLLIISAVLKIGNIMISWNMKEHANFTISFIFIKYEKYFQIDIEHTKWKILSVLVNITYYEIFHNLKEYFIFTQSVILFQNDKNTDEFNIDFIISNL